MRTLLKTLFITSCLWGMLLYWWKPADNLVAVKPVNWQQKYKDDITDPKPSFGAMKKKKKIIRENQTQPTIEEYIRSKTADCTFETTDPKWQSWIDRRLNSPNIHFDQYSFFKNNDPVFSNLGNTIFGYIKIITPQGGYYASFDLLETDELGKKHVPTALRYPTRNLAFMLAGIICFIFMGKKFVGPKRDLVMQSTAGTGMHVFMGIFTGGWALILLPFFYHWRYEGPPFIFLGGFTVIIGVIGLSLFGYQCVFVEKLIREGNHLAHWTYPAQEWQSITEQEYKTERREKQMLLIFISTIILIVGGIFWIAVRDEAATIVFICLLGLIALLAVIAILVPWLNYRRNIKQTGEIFIGENGVYLNGAVHTWRLLGSRIEVCERQEEPFSCIHIVYSYWMMAGRILYFYRNNAVIRIPIPKDKEDEAKKIISTLTNG
ncbi:MAG: hypothetical protein KC713_06635 [Candidatus Omnitrophica bacterium]|nr:hypothetical protein [Candidatus Omnitrophota bacterium]